MVVFVISSVVGCAALADKTNVESGAACLVFGQEDQGIFNYQIHCVNGCYVTIDGEVTCDGKIAAVCEIIGNFTCCDGVIC